MKNIITISFSILILIFGFSEESEETNFVWILFVIASLDYTCIKLYIHNTYLVSHKTKMPVEVGSNL